jgi:hypothetical protein
VLHGDLIGAVVEVGDREIALCVGGFLVVRAGPNIGNGNIGAGNHRVAGVGYGAGQSPGQNLSIGDTQRERDHQDEGECETAEYRTGELNTELESCIIPFPKSGMPNLDP